MENETIKNRIQQALDCVQGLDEPYRGLAFQVVLERLLQEGADGRRADPKPEAREGGKGFTPINEFYSSLSLKSHTDSVVAIAYYLLHAESAPLFTIREVSERLSKCRAEKPKNLSDVLAGCAKNGWLAEGSQKIGGMKSWYLTSTGEKYFQSKLKPAEG
ncbi:MAG TPA: hypothetical protein VI382_06200 [Candidatus Manganitrophaceae bacterium]|nr:hypothetical protein [Candidatus Manganitrophaceae bacterium]